jgi:RND family efflux transporter MFP subunit
VDLEALKIDRSSAARRPGRRRRGGLGWVVLLVACAVALWLFRAPLSRKLDDLRLTRVRALRVVATSAASAAAVSGTAANGYVVARTRAALSADTPGRIVELNVSEGSVVRRGDVVARLYSDEAEAALRAAQAEVATQNAAVARLEADLAVAQGEIARAASDLEGAAAAVAEALAALHLAELERARAEALVADAVESVARLDQTRAAEGQARARLDAARAGESSARTAADQAQRHLAAAQAAANEAHARIGVVEALRDQAAATLDKTIVRAPFDGVVVLKDAEVGEVVSPNSQGAQSRGSVATMVDFQSLEVQVELPEASLGSVRLDGLASIFLDAYPGDGYTGRVLRVWPTANRQKGTVEVRVGFDAIDERLRPEMGARVVFLDEERGGPTDAAPSAGVLRIPTDSLVRSNGRSGVFVIEQDVLSFREIQSGEEKSGRVHVVAGLQEGERIVLEPAASLRDGERVRVEGDAR